MPLTYDSTALGAMAEGTFKKQSGWREVADKALGFVKPPTPSA